MALAATTTASSSSSREEVKVVLVDTQYVVTDPTSFKSVVQSLTGKDSCVAWIDESGFTGAKRRKRPVNGNGGGAGNNGISSSSNGSPVSAGAGLDDSGCGDWILPNDLSFKDLDRMMLDLPPLEWHKLWPENAVL